MSWLNWIIIFHLTLWSRYLAPSWKYSSHKNQWLFYPIIFSINAVLFTFLVLTLASWGLWTLTSRWHLFTYKSARGFFPELQNWNVACICSLARYPGQPFLGALPFSKGFSHNILNLTDRVVCNIRGYKEYPHFSLTFNLSITSCRYQRTIYDFTVMMFVIAQYFKIVTPSYHFVRTFKLINVIKRSMFIALIGLVLLLKM